MAPRILIVEDDFFVASDLEAAFSEAGMQIVGVARTAEEAVALAQSERPALAIMDIRLASKRDGIDAAREIFSTTGIRCIFATAHYDRQTQARAEAAMPLGWVPKPYSTAAVVTATMRALAELKKTR